MLNKDISILEIKKELENKGDFIQIDYLTKLLNQKVSQQVRRFIHEKLEEIYEKKTMYIDAAKICNNLAIESIAFSEKRRYHLKEAGLYILAGKFNETDEAMKKAMREANASEKIEIFITIKEFYKRHAKLLETKRKKNSALKIYEKLLKMNLSDREKKEIQEKILELYENLGKIREYMALKRLKNQNL
ncbi:hypothetical protein DRN73_01970 [Candidatus Pacearchaeota archaeon]|nr:MAG: hypothetical protein DRN73_01970 [Candidatus Pacearchaeota archaeon]